MSRKPIRPFPAPVPANNPATRVHAPKLRLLSMALSASIGVTLAAPVVGQNVSGLQFGQLDWYAPNQTLLVQDSSWGYLSFDVTAHPTDTYYFNLAGDAGLGSAWLVQNLPVFSLDLSTTTRLGVDFAITDLGINEGTDLNALSYTWSLTPSTIPAPPVSNPSTTSTIATIERKAAGDLLTQFPNASDIGAPAGHKGPVREATEVIEHKNVPEVQEADNKCLAGAFARSLAWLNDEYDLNHPRTAQQIYDDLVAAGVTGPRPATHGSYEQQIQAKHQYFRGMTNKAVTKILDPSNYIDLSNINEPGLCEVPNADIVDWLYQELPTEDVELHYGGHIVTIVGIYKKNDKIYVRYRDDETQGPNNTTINNVGDKEIKDAELVKVGGTYRFRRNNTNYQIHVVISESVVCPLTTTFQNDNGGALGGAIYFDLAAVGKDVTIKNFDLNFGPGSSAGGSLQVYTAPNSSVGIEGNASAWTLHDLANCPQTMPRGVPSTCLFASTPLTIPADTSIGVAIVCGPMLQHAYTTGTASTPLVYEQCPLTLTAGSASNVPFAGPVFTPRIVNTNLYLNANGDCATVTRQGEGCGSGFASFYEVLTAASIDLNGLTVSGNNTGFGYSVTAGPGVANPIGSLGPTTALPLGDDDVQPAGTLGLEVGSNCQVFLGSGGSTAFAPSVPTFLGTVGSPATWAAWTDLEPNAVGSGPIVYEESGTVAQITYDGVFGWSTTDPNFVQFVIDTSNGNFQITFGTTAATNPEDWLVGFSPAGPNLDPGPVDISTGPVATAPLDGNPLVLAANGRPVQGTSPQPFDVTTSNIEPGTLIHVGLIGLSRPGLPVPGFGPGNCVLHASLDILTAVVPLPGSSVTWSPLTLPAAPSFSGFEFNCQAATFNAMIFNPSSRLSNGLKCVVGSL